MTTRNTLRQAFAGAAGIAIALFSAVVMSAPASATDALQTGSDHNSNPLSVSVKDKELDLRCDGAKGQWNITWTLANDGNRDATIIGVTTTPNASGVTVVGSSPEQNLDGALIPKKDHNKAGEIKALEVLDGNATSATLEIEVSWNQVQGTSSSGTVKKSGTVRLYGGCKKTQTCVSAASAHFSHVFNGPAGTATISLDGDKPLCDGQSQKFLLVSYFAPSPRAEWPQYKFDTDVQTIDNEHSRVDLAVDVPACFTQVDLVFGDELINPMVANGPRYNDRKLGSGGAPGNRSSGGPAWYNGGRSTCAMPEATMTSSCDGSVIVHLSNGGDAHYAVPFKVTAGLNGPKFTKDVSVEPGKSVEVEIPATSADKITVTTDGDFIAEGMWQPGHCQLPTVRQESTCDTLKIFVSNPEGNLPADVTITYGTHVEHRTVAAGHTEEVDFSATDKTQATVDFADFDKSVTVVYNRSQDCESPSPEPSTQPSQPGSSTPPSTQPSPSTPGLPVTGVQVGVFAGIGALLLGAGAVLLLGARRRRLTESQ